MQQETQVNKGTNVVYRTNEGTYMYSDPENNRKRAEVLSERLGLIGDHSATIINAINTFGPRFELALVWEYQWERKKQKEYQGEDDIYWMENAIIKDIMYQVEQEHRRQKCIEELLLGGE